MENKDIYNLSRDYKALYEWIGQNQTKNRVRVLGFIENNFHGKGPICDDVVGIWIWPNCDNPEMEPRHLIGSRGIGWEAYYVPERDGTHKGHFIQNCENLNLRFIPPVGMITTEITPSSRPGDQRAA